MSKKGTKTPRPARPATGKGYRGLSRPPSKQGGVRERPGPGVGKDIGDSAVDRTLYTATSQERWRLKRDNATFCGT